MESKKLADEKQAVEDDIRHEMIHHMLQGRSYKSWVICSQFVHRFELAHSSVSREFPRRAFVLA